MQQFKETLLRQQDLIPLEVLGTPITIIGAGAVGSWTALALVKMGFLNLSVIDPDVIDTHNISNQFYPIDSIGTHKVDALNKMLHQFTGYNINVSKEYFKKGNKLPDPIVIAAVDSMQVRKDIFESCGESVKWMIDPRMGAEAMSLYTMKPSLDKDKEDYEKAWHSDEDSVHLPCTAKTTMYCANILSGLVAMNVKKLLVDKQYTRIMMLDLPSMDLNQWSSTTGSVTEEKATPNNE